MYKDTEWPICSSMGTTKAYRSSDRDAPPLLPFADAVLAGFPIRGGQRKISSDDETNDKLIDLLIQKLCVVKEKMTMYKY